MTSTVKTSFHKQTGTFESFDGTPIYYEVRGEGPPIVMAYGIACLMNHWTHQTKYFSRNYQTILFDYRGHHKTPAPSDPQQLSLDAIVKDIHGLMAHLNIPRASFWGHSYGAQILLRAYDLNPELFENIVLINGFATNPIKKMFGVDWVPKAFDYFKLGYLTYPQPLSALWRLVVRNPLTVPLSALAGGFNLNLTHLKDVEVYAKGVANMDLQVFISLFEEMMAYDGSSVLEKIRTPTLIISGEKDGVTPVSYQEELHRKINGSQLLKVPYGSHCTQLDLPEFVNLRIEKFLRELDYS